MNTRMYRFCYGWCQIVWDAAEWVGPRAFLLVASPLWIVPLLVAIGIERMYRWRGRRRWQAGPGAEPPPIIQAVLRAQRVAPLDGVVVGPRLPAPFEPPSLELDTEDGRGSIAIGSMLRWDRASQKLETLHTAFDGGPPLTINLLHDSDLALWNWGIDPDTGDSNDCFPRLLRLTAAEGIHISVDIVEVEDREN